MLHVANYLARLILLVQVANSHIWRLLWLVAALRCAAGLYLVRFRTSFRSNASRPLPWRDGRLRTPPPKGKSSHSFWGYGINVLRLKLLLRTLANQFTH